jgi:hypothetical protein
MMRIAQDISTPSLPNFVGGGKILVSRRLVGHLHNVWLWVRRISGLAAVLIGLSILTSSSLSAQTRSAVGTTLANTPAPSTASAQTQSTGPGLANNPALSTIINTETISASAQTQVFVGVNLADILALGTLNIEAGAEGEPVGGTVIPFSKNEDIDTLWAYSRLVDCSEETVVDTVGLNRYFTDVTIVPDGGTWAAMNVGRIEIRTSVGGFDLESLCTVPGDWGQIRDVASAGASGIRFTVPRMSYEEEFTLVFYELEGGGLDGGELEVWDLQEMLISSNYSWSKDDLDDVIVHRSGTDAGIGLEIAPWTPGSVYDWHSE